MHVGYNDRGMAVYLITFGAFLTAVLAMAIGYVVRGKALKGSCGGVGPDGKMLADCLCERLKKPICDDRKRTLEAARGSR